MNFSEMTDFEIDAAVAAIMHPGLKITNFAGEAVVWFGNLETRIVRYCNSWTDAGLLIQGSKIDLEAPFGSLNLWEAKSRDEQGHMVNWCADCNPLRAAMVVFLMMHAEEEPQPSKTPQIDNDGWIEWSGGECPIEDRTWIVEIKFRDGETDKRHAAGYRWVHYGKYNDIIAYRVIENDGREG